MDKVMRCQQCGGLYGPTMDDLVEHIYHSPEHEVYIRMICGGRDPDRKWWQFWK